MTNQIVVKQAKALDLTPDLIRKYICPSSSPTDAEIGLFLELCQSQSLNPFLREAYLIKYGTSPAQIVVGKEGFLKRANKNPAYEGHAVSCSVGPDGLTATAKVYKKGFRHAVEVEVDFSEYSTGKNLWKSKPKTMLKKVALCQALREAFPDTFGGMYGQEEVGAEGLDQAPIVIEPDTAPKPRLLAQPKRVSDQRQWPEILEKYKPHLEEHGLTEADLGLLTLDQFAELRGAVFGS